MAMMNASPWNGQDHSMSPSGDDEFHQFFDIGMSGMGDSMAFDFNDFTAQSGPSMMQAHRRDPVDTPMSDANVSSLLTHANMPPMSTASGHPTIPSQILTSQPPPNDTISEIDAQIHFLQHQRLQQQQRQLEEQQRRLHEQQAAFYAQQQQRNMVPPTPQSLELQAGGHIYTAQDQGHSSGMFDSYRQLKEQHDMAFTPLVSPAVTPLDTHFSAEHQFTVPGAYFSPISSPALHAQNDSTSAYDQRHSGHTHNSPATMDVESPSALSISDAMTKGARKTAAPRRKSKVRQSPITKPQRKKTASTPVMNGKALTELAEAVTVTSEAPLHLQPVPASSGEESENASVSPEALEMPPPPLPLPRSARQSPYMAPQTSDKPPHPTVLRNLSGKPSPATPASLFRISPKNKTADSAHAECHAPEHIESLELPESIGSMASSKHFSPIEKSRPPSQSSTELATPKMTPLAALPPLSLPQSSQPPSASPSPQLTPRSSTPAFRTTPLLGAKPGRKRPSISSNSPALLPRISPNIKPLLPGTPGLKDEDTASKLLASKSNYQRILEGNTMPGVTYPSELSTNLTSKRTSHKIAEQGRRNRINSALHDIAALLPKSVIKEGDQGDGDSGSGDKKDGKQSTGQGSKASTVELAIEYIKQLQKELAEANKRADAAEQKLRETTLAES
ncbi:hypothetical protein F5Y18DRAFT_391165 [Xylariaceae sp. FL1019]|nr:hypothetical protein F5Y18DRAFT_391165 [Xylariaceae sp. FL1019]